MSNHHDIAERYLAIWNESDNARRRDLIADVWAEAAQYSDPLMQGEGHDGIDTMIAGARAQFPGHRFSLAGTPDGHGSTLRFSWRLAPEGGGVAVARGTDFAMLDADGRLVRVIGFLDQPLAGA